MTIPLVAVLVLGGLLLWQSWQDGQLGGLCADVAALLAVLALLLTPAGPEKRHSAGNGPAIALAVDVSTSMGARDSGISRLEQAQRELHALIAALPQARFSLTLFAGEGVIQVPLTEDREALLFFIDRLQPGMVAAPGSAPEEGVLTALQTLANVGGERVVVLASDGERTVPGPAPRLPDTIAVQVLILGNSAGAPLREANGTLRFDRHGTALVTRPDRSRLELLAVSTHGTVLRSQGNAPATLQLAERWPAPLDQAAATRWWLWGAALLLVLRQVPWPRPHFRLTLGFGGLLLGSLIACGTQQVDPAEEQFHAGLRLAKAGSNDAAHAAFAEAAALTTGHRRGLALYNLGTLQLAGGNADQAVTTLEQALIQLPGDMEVRTNLVLALRALGDRPPSGLGDGTHNGDGANDAPLNREQALQLIETVKPQAMATSASDAQVRERRVEKDW